MSRTIGAAVGAVIVFLFFVFGVAHSRVTPGGNGAIASSRP